MTEVVFVRHAQTSWSGSRYCSRSDPRLTAAGRRAAATLADALAPTLGPEVSIVSSPARRARETAAAIAAAAGIADIEIDEDWREADFGAAEGRTFDELARLAPRLAEALARGDTSIDWPAGETAADLETRIHAAWSGLLARDRPVVVVSHAGALRQAIAFARSVPPGAVDLPAPASAVRVGLSRERNR
jgi:probable phosphoglycerate mutase